MGQTPTPESIDQILAGLWQDQQNEVDVFVIEDIRNQLFQNPADGGPPADLIAFNLQRSRDHGLPSLNQLRSALQLEPYDDFEDLVAGGNGMTPSAEQQIVADNLRIVYGDVANVELWIGGVAEPGFAGGNFGETLTFVVSLQYQTSELLMLTTTLTDGSLKMKSTPSNKPSSLPSSLETLKSLKCHAKP